MVAYRREPSISEWFFCASFRTIVFVAEMFVSAVVCRVMLGVSFYDKSLIYFCGSQKTSCVKVGALLELVEKSLGDTICSSFCGAVLCVSDKTCEKRCSLFLKTGCCFF